MKQSFKSGAVVVLCIFFILFSLTLSIRLLVNKEGHEKVKLSEMVNGGSLVELKDSELMNVFDGDEDCSKRRIMAEAHLDYIYTQHHKP
ncbi:phytosulfokines 6 [Pyrus ussuriensis x Pyrus communis]|uniref:Phytosulfokine n=1 Tax=Pyrus ussuriensis x Pyrus communis TaxID=2448454 RepID=A0A5N5FUM4_9ROSA|nr:phytosulfokines 6 [Pyrus ussuriensis x Pyrus communis]